MGLSLLFLGMRKTREAGNFLSGLIDDVRIYDVALRAKQIVAPAQ